MGGLANRYLAPEESTRWLPTAGELDLIGGGLSGLAGRHLPELTAADDIVDAANVAIGTATYGLRNAGPRRQRPEPDQPQGPEPAPAA